MAVLPEVSVTVQITVVTPFAYVVLGWLFVVLATPQLSPVVGVPRLPTVALHDPASVLAVILAGQVIVGGVLST